MGCSNWWLGHYLKMPGNPHGCWVLVNMTRRLTPKVTPSWIENTSFTRPDRSGGCQGGVG
jgi:hypothetical protein